jgi:hypothetical protein
MNKEFLKNAVDTAKAKTKEALETIYNALNHGQQKQLVKNEKVRVLFDLYEVEYEE